MDVCAAWSGYGPMHRIFFFVVLVALAAWLDSYLNDGFTREPLRECFQIFLFILTRPGTGACSLGPTGS